MPTTVASILIVAVVAVVAVVAWCGVALRRRADQVRAADVKAATATVAAERVAARSASYRNALLQVRDGVLVVDKEGHVAFANDAAEAILDSEDRTLASRLVSAGKRAASGTEVTSSRAESTELGRMFEISASTPVVGDDGVVLVIDVSDQARIEAMRTDFVANASHELKTPLGALSLLAEAISGASDDAMRARLSSQIRNEAKRLARVVDDILQLAEAEAVVTARETTKVVDIVRDAVDLATDQISEANGSVSTGDVTEATVKVNRTQVTLAMQNLVTNALAHAYPGEGRGPVTVSAVEDGRFIRFSVEDRGVGIAPRHLDRIFERFFRVDRARSRTSGGTGLGLSIVRHVTMSHGGDVGVESTVGEGSTFWMRIPAGEVT